MAWLVTPEGKVVASLEEADSFGARRRGLLGRDGIDGVLWIDRTRSVHTLGMRFPIDVAFCDADLTITRIVTVPPHRPLKFCWRARSVLEAEAGSFGHWGLAVGDQVEIRR